MTLVERASSCVLGWAVGTERSWAVLQDLVSGSLPAQQYYSDGFAGYAEVDYTPGRHNVAVGKSETYRVEGVNAELRHYLGRLRRKSRCFSRSLVALRRAVRLFVHAWNGRQLQRRAFPAYQAHVCDFV